MIDKQKTELRILSKPIVLFDGDCGMCRRTITWVAKRDPDNVFCYHEFQTAPSPPMTPELTKACERAVHVVLPDGTILRGAVACLYMLQVTGWGRLAPLLMLPPFVWAAHIGYRVVADHRPFWSHIIFRQDQSDGKFTGPSLQCD